uniref:Uncharacterized protein n=1 Tax=Arundo donax TaxID=35708 RepID=A0A0A9EUG0_ARUDO
MEQSDEEKTKVAHHRWILMVERAGPDSAPSPHGFTERSIKGGAMVPLRRKAARRRCTSAGGGPMQNPTTAACYARASSACYASPFLEARRLHRRSARCSRAPPAGSAAHDGGGARARTRAPAARRRISRSMGRLLRRPRIAGGAARTGMRWGARLGMQKANGQGRTTLGLGD